MALATLFWIMPAESYAIRVPFEAIEVTTEFAGAAATRLADVDDNGSIDVVGVATDDGTIAWWENVDDNGTLWIQHPILAVEDVRTLDTADVDGDGDIDVISASFSLGIVAWLENDGTGLNWTPTVIATGVDGPSSISAADVDGDGDLDVIGAAEDGNAVLWWENGTGGGDNWAERSVFVGVNGPREVTSGDVDEDGDIDILVAANGEGAVVWFENQDGAGLVWSPNLISVDFPGAAAVRVGDVNLDGTQDIVASGDSGGTVAWWSNELGDGSLWTETTIDDSFGGANSILIGDIDRDGDVDVMSTASTGDEIAWWENADFLGTSWIKQSIETGVSGPNDVRFGDIDADGDPDVLATLGGAGAIFWWDNVSVHRQSIFPGQIVVNSDVPGASVVVAEDLDNDGDLDLVASASTGQDIRWWQNDANGLFWTERIVDGGFNGALNVDTADVDGDGDFDVLGAAQTDDRIAWWENLFGDGLTWIEHSIVSNFNGAFDVDTADIDGDGDIDVIATAELDDEVIWFENVLGDGLAWIPHDIDTNADGARSASASDFDGDGDLDVIGAMNDANDITWWENFDGVGGDWITRTIEGGFNGADMVAGGDIDRDGDIDVVAVAIEADDIKWWENEDGLGTTWTERTIEGNFNGATSIVVTDMDADGDVDLLATADVDDDIRWWENLQGNGLAWSDNFITGDFDGASWAIVADINQDGQIDVAGAGSNVGDIRWWRNLGGQVSYETRNEAPTAMADGDTTDILSIEVIHEGRVGDVDIELAEIRLLLEESNNVPLENGAANALIESIFIYVDEGSDRWEPELDTLVTAVGTLDLVEGEFTVILPDGDPALQVEVGEPKRIFIVVQLTGDASLQEVTTFEITHLTELSVVEDANDVVMDNQGAPTVGSRNVRAAGTVPVLSVTGVCPGPITVTVTNTTPGEMVQIIQAQEEGTFTLGGGRCAGIDFDLAQPTLFDTLFANIEGTAISVLLLAPNQCESFMQAQDGRRCLPSNVIQLPATDPPPLN